MISDHDFNPKRETVIKRLRKLYKYRLYLQEHQKQFLDNKSGSQYINTTKSLHAIGFAIRTILLYFEAMNINPEEYCGPNYIPFQSNRSESD